MSSKRQGFSLFFVQEPVPSVLELSFRGFRGREYNAISIGRCMKRLGFETKKIRGVIKYLVTKVDPDLHNRENKEDAKQFVPEIF